MDTEQDAVQIRYKNERKNGSEWCLTNRKGKKKGAHNERLFNIWWYMIIDCNQKLLADAEVGEDVVQGVVAGDFAAGDFADWADGVPEVER